MRYQDDGRAVVDTVVLSTQHAPGLDLAQLREAILEDVILPVIGEELRSPSFRTLINPAGAFEIGGPKGDTGLTGRKIIVDTYGGACPHGGGAFSGKDATKVDRSGAYVARWLAKHVVAAGIAPRCTVQLAYAIGVAEPVSVAVDLHGHPGVDPEAVAQALTTTLRPHAGGDHPRARAGPADLHPHRSVRPLRPRRTRFHLGTHAADRRAARGVGMTVVEIEFPSLSGRLTL